MAKRPHLRLVTNAADTDVEEGGMRSRRRAARKAVPVHGTGKYATGSSSRVAATSPSQAYSKTLKAKTENQVVLMEAIDSMSVVMAMGPAGTGKTHIAVRKAVEALQAGRVKRIVMSRPAIEAGEKLGFLPGDADAKMDPYMRPLYDELLSCVAPQVIKAWLAEKVLEVAPIGFMRGRTLSDCFVVVDEAQNLTALQLKMVLTRLGFGSKMVITGDPDQVDLPQGQSGLVDIAGRLDGRATGVGIVRLEDVDVVRHPVVKAVLEVLAA
jgi:phosphate starvation-inducible PhoH-like protein